VIVIAPHSPRTFVGQLDFQTTTGARTTQVITDLGVLEPREGELTLTALHPGVSVKQAREATGWPLRLADALATTPEATDEELSALRELIARG
jgi:glutaconate CoA-transferase subunit B